MKRHCSIGLCILLLSFSIATRAVATAVPRILSRAQWGADETFLIRGSDEDARREEPETAETDNGAASGRVRACEEAQRNYPAEFAASRTEETDAAGRTLRWARRYSPAVRLLVVHHTALAVTGDPRPPVERMRALYEYHANSLNWGDIGYHYVIDENGQIYEGRSGGHGIVGGHVYCGNIGTIGIALMGNFEMERPTDDQIRRLQWLLDALAKEYDIDLQQNVSYHGRTLPPISRHRDLVPTACPGYYLDAGLAQIRANVLAGNLDAPVRFPTLAQESRTDRTAERLEKRIQTLPRKYYRARRLVRTAERQRPAVRTGANVDSAKPQRSARAERPTQRAATRAETSTSGPSADGTLSIRIRLTQAEGACEEIQNAGRYRGTINCVSAGNIIIPVNELPLEDYLLGLSEEPDTEPFEKQKAFAVAARSYAAYYGDPTHRKFPGMPYDGDDSAARFQQYGGRAFEERNPEWVRAVRETAGQVLTKDGEVVKAAYFSSSDGRTRSPEELGWKDFPFAEIFRSKPDPWCKDLELRGHGVGMSGCGARGQAEEGGSAEEILNYYYPGTEIGILE